MIRDPLALQNEALADTAARFCRRIQTFALRGYLGIVCLYLTLGNLPRMISVSGLRDKISLTEYLLFLTSIAVGVLIPSITRTFFIRWFAVVWIILFSTIYGALINEFAFTPTLYAIRLLLLLYAGFVAGCALFRRYGTDFAPVLRLILGAFAVVVAIGAVVFFVFPDLTVLWRTLGDVGLGFLGDPHRRRFVSTFFDPNYYAATAGLYVVACFVLWQYRRSFWVGALLVACLISIFLTGSRSGVAALAMVLAGLAWENRMAFARVLVSLRVKRTSVWMAGGLLAGVVVLSPLYLSSLATTWERFSVMATDQSAQSRFVSLRFGMDLIEERPLLGLGYNYLLPVALEVRGVTSLDSSVQVTVINFGLLFSLAFLGMLVLWAARTSRRLASWTTVDPQFPLAFRLYLWYLAVTVVFTSHFNNVLYLPFWLVPMTMLGTYFSCIPRRVTSKTCRSLAEPRDVDRQRPETV